MKPNDHTDHEIADSIDIQARIIFDAYASGDHHEIEQALIIVTNARRMLQNGMLDLISSYPEDDSHSR